MEDKYMQFSQNAETGEWTPDFPLKEAEMPNLAELPVRETTFAVFNRGKSELWGTFTAPAWVDDLEDVCYLTLDAWEAGRENAHTNFMAWIAEIAPICEVCGRKTSFYGVGKNARVFRCFHCNDNRRYISEERHA